MVTVLPRRVLSVVLVVCFGCTPTALLACAVICAPGMMSHGAMPDAAPVAEASGHEYMHHAMPAQPAASSSVAPRHQAATVTVAVAAAASTDAIGPGCCAHTAASAAASTTASRVDTTALVSPGATPEFVTAPTLQVASVRATLVSQSLPPPPTRAPVVLRI